MRMVGARNLHGRFADTRRDAGVFAAQTAVALAILGLGGAMLFGADIMVQAFDRLGAGGWVRVAIGSVEVIAGLCLLLPRSAMAGAALLIALCIGVSGAVIVDTTRGTQQQSASSMLAAPYVERAIHGGFAPAHIIAPARERDI